MTVTHRKRQHQPEEITTVNEPGLQIHCDSCACDLTHSIRIKCADPVCDSGDDVDICPACFCAGKEFGKHKRWHAYRVVELHSYPIFSEDWGADEELLLLEGTALQGLGNWHAIAEHVGTRTKEEVEKHYNEVYIESPHWPSPRMDLEFNVDPSEFQERKRRRISNMNTTAPLPVKLAPTSAPGIHEIGSFLPGRLEFEHEIDNDAEALVKDLEFGVCLAWGGDEIPEDKKDVDVLARAKWEKEKRATSASPVERHPTNGILDGIINGQLSNGNGNNGRGKTGDIPKNAGTGSDAEGEVEDLTQPPPTETADSLAFKLTLLEMYRQRVEKRHETKAVIFDRGLLNHKQMQAAEKKRPKDEKEIVYRLRPFARLQTAEDFELFSTDILYEAMLRKKVAELQHYRRMGLTATADIEKYEADVIKRAQAKANLTRDFHSSERLQQLRTSGRGSSGPDPRRGIPDDERESTPKPGTSAAAGGAPLGRKLPAPLNLANSPSLHLLTPEEQTLCSQLRIQPKPYLVIKETLVREYARRGGKLRRREARDLVKIDVNKTSRVWDFLVQAGFLKVGVAEPAPAADLSRPSATPSLSASPSKDSQMRVSPRPPPFTTAPLTMPFNFTPGASLPNGVGPWPPS